MIYFGSGCEFRITGSRKKFQIQPDPDPTLIILNLFGNFKIRVPDIIINRKEKSTN